MKQVRLLLLSGASQVGQSVLAALAGRRSGVEIMATGSSPRDLAVFDFDASFVTPATASDPEAFERRLLDIVSATSPALLIPCRDDDVVALSDLRWRFPDLRALCGSPAAARVMADKWLSASFATDHDLPFAPTWAAGCGQGALDFARTNGYPLIAKPRSSFASRGVYLVRNERQLEQASSRAGYLLQKFLGDAVAVQRFCDEVEASGVPLFHSFEGAMDSMQALIGRDGAVAQVVCTTARMRHGRSEYVGLQTDPFRHALGTRCALAFSDLGWRGPLNVQCQTTQEGQVLIHEFNGRFTGATGARRLLGHDEVGPAIELFTGHKLPPDPLRIAAAHEVLRVPVAFAVDRDRVDALCLDGVCRRDASAGV